MNYEELLDFMTNGFEHGTDEENKAYLMSEFGLKEYQANALVKNAILFSDPITTVEGVQLIKDLIK